jgi:hypothetical protein
MTDKSLPPLPSPREFILKVPLYTPYAYDEDTKDGVWELKYFSGSIEGYCPWCTKDSIWVRYCQEKPEQFKHLLVQDHSFWVEFTCALDVTHKLSICVRAANGVLQKIGQYPSIADLAAGDLKKYRKVLGKDRLFEFNRAIGLAAHGVGIGAFVYLGESSSPCCQKRRYWLAKTLHGTKRSSRTAAWMRRSTFSEIIYRISSFRTAVCTAFSAKGFTNSWKKSVKDTSKLSGWESR